MTIMYSVALLIINVLKHNIWRRDKNKYNMAIRYGKLNEFNSSKETWNNFVERLEFFFAANEIDDNDKKKAILLSASSPETYTLCLNLCSPHSPAEKSYTELKDLIKGHLHPTSNPVAERFKFNSRDRKSGENISSFMASLRHLTEHCEFGTTVEVMLRDRLVCGINNKRTTTLVNRRTNTYSYKSVRIGVINGSGG